MIDRHNDRSHIAWDIETTGFGWNDEITVSGFWFPSGHAYLLLNAETAVNDGEALQSSLRECTGVPVEVDVCENESALIEAMRTLVFDRFDVNYNRLVAFNADSWQGGFDLPFLRTRCFHHDHPWVFDGVQFADLWEPVSKRLNTTEAVHKKSVDVNSLTGSHQILFASDSHRSLTELPENHILYQSNPYDPFSNSGSAVYCYLRGEYFPVLQHNLADVHRTWELGELVRQYVPAIDITTKKL